MNYKDTLNMPKTDFEMKGKLPTKEPIIQARWEELDLFELLLKEREGNKSFVLHDGPPYANGDIHIGHGLNKVLKDIVNRSKSAQGYYTPYIPGWDTHGLPIETAIAKSGINRKEMSVADFRKLCEEYANKQIAIQMEGFKRLGSIGDYKDPYITMSKGYEAEQIKVFGKMATDGLIYQGFKPVYWSPSSETALAEGELEYHEKKDTSIYIKFNVINGNGILDEDVSFMCWTTMPWTVTTTVGVAVGAKFEYGLYETNKGKLVFAKELEEDIIAKTGLEVKLIKTLQGKELEKITALNPYSQRECLVVLGDHVTTTDGTGCVTVAPGHGDVDFIVGNKYGLELLVACDAQGKMVPETGEEIAGMYWEKANKFIIASLEESGKLVAAHDLVHRYPYDWRTKKPVVFKATLQWFASIEEKREQILDQIEKVNWTPSWGKLRMHNMIADRGDWCISRQRAWGVPIPIIFDENNQPLIDNDIFDFVSDKFREYGSNYWFDSEVKDLLPSKYLDGNHPIDKYRKEVDTMDVWFDSGSSHTSVIKARGLEYPVDLYLEGSDQYRGWFNSSLIIGTCINGEAPYRSVLSHGFSLDSKGEKMSKSIGNTIEPKKVFNQYGADVFRFWVSSVDYQSDFKVSDESLKQVADSYRKVRNTFKFILGNLKDFNKSDLLDIEELSDVDKYMLIKLNKLNDKCINAYNSYDFNVVYNSINNY
ncbi:MAG: isoleucine--tRNA ligase, partial [Erysipelotrichales bacterium]